MKKYLLLLLILLLTSCTQKNKIDIKDEKKVIELDDKNSKTSKEVNSKNFYLKNESINSKIYKEYFYDYNFLPSKELESEMKNGILYVKGTDLPISQRFFSKMNYVSFTYDKKLGKLNVAAILKKSEKVNNNKLDKDIIVHWIYDIKESKLLSLEQEDIDGKELDIINFNDHQWNEISKDYQSFSKQISN